MASNSELQGYMQDVGRHIVLSEEAQIRHCRNIALWQATKADNSDLPESYISKIKRRGQHSMKIMVESNLRMVITIAKIYRGRGLEFPDLIQEGNMGLIRGLEKYDPSRGYRLSTYCYNWIRQSITRALHNQGRAVRVPLNYHEILCKVQRESMRVEATTGVKPSIEYLALFAKVTVERLKLIMEDYSTTTVRSLSCPAVEGGSELIELLVADTPPEDDPSPSLFPQLALPSSEHRQVMAALRSLPSREHYVVEQVVIHGKSLQEVADDIYLSKSRISQLLKSGKSKLLVKMNELSERE
jgi:RNA polymerase sigma factor (sigma-70 family)